MHTSSRKVLIIDTGSLGHVSHGLRVAHTFLENDPRLTIDWVARRRCETVVSACKAISRTFVFEREGGFGSYLRLAQRLRREQYDYVFDFQGLARTAFLLALCHADRKVGRADAREGATLFYGDLVPPPANPDERHMVDRLLQFCRVFGFEPTLAGRLEFEGVELRRPRSETRLISIFPFSGRSALRWQNCPALASVLGERFPEARIQLLGERPLDHRLDSRRVEDATGQTNRRQLLDRLAESDLVIGCDVGPVKLAAALGLPTISVVGARDPRKDGAYPIDPSQHGIVRSRDSESGVIDIGLIVDHAEKLLRACPVS